MSLDITISGVSIIRGNPKIDTELFKAELSIIDKGPYELNRVQKIAAIAFVKSLSDAGITLNESNRKRISIFLGNSYAIEEFKATFLKSYKNTKPGLVNPSTFTFTTANSISSWLGMLFGIRGINLTFTNGCISSSQAIIAGCDSIISGKSDIAVVGGISLICEDLNDEFYKSGFRHEYAGFLVLEKKNDLINIEKKPLIIIEDFLQGFLSQVSIEALNDRRLPKELEKYRHHSDTVSALLHLGNSLRKNKFSYYDEKQKQGRVSAVTYLNDQLGNVFSAAAIAGISCIDKKSVFFDVDSYGAYVALKINAK